MEGEEKEKEVEGIKRMSWTLGLKKELFFFCYDIYFF